MVFSSHRLNIQSLSFVASRWKIANLYLHPVLPLAREHPSKSLKILISIDELSAPYSTSISPDLIFRTQSTKLADQCTLLSPLIRFVSNTYLVTLKARLHMAFTSVVYLQLHSRHLVMLIGLGTLPIVVQPVGFSYISATT